MSERRKMAKGIKVKGGVQPDCRRRVKVGANQLFAVTQPQSVQGQIQWGGSLA